MKIIRGNKRVERTKILNKLGLKVIRFTNNEIVKELEKVYMSLNNKTKLVEIEKVVFRELRSNSTKAKMVFCES
ncbi:MAG: hypothetical protein COW08_00580 [Ignavibacteriales bacterium CG12_big_fil_rev_8_21_14_0_65_30_8]|nr:MAG: hypothetical protein COW08_00580 [Ignavibacteriales bacterium CG12_big_fil_rev_8_21_14_0_65_30_8]